MPEKNQIQERILEILKAELEYDTKEDNYNQWILGVSIKKDRAIGNPKYTARVVIKTSESPYVDGMNINFTIPEGDVLIDPNYYENTPEFQGGTVQDSINWLKELEDIYHLKLENPLIKS